MPTVETPHGTLFYAASKRGAGCPMILIHGAGSSHLGWPAELRRFEHHQVLTIDLPGHGRAEPTGRQSVEAYAQSVLALMEVLALPPSVLVGHSMGGAIAQMITLLCPTRVAGLVLIGTGATLFVNDKILQGIREDHVTTAAMINKWSWSKDTPEAIREQGLKELLKVPAEVLYGDYLACSQFDVRPRLGEISVPTLVISGTMDKMTPLEVNRTLIEGISGASLAVIEQVGHNMMLEQPHQVAAAIVKWGMPC